jgi:hypothetical protein
MSRTMCSISGFFYSGVHPANVLHVHAPLSELDSEAYHALHCLYSLSQSNHASYIPTNHHLQSSEKEKLADTLCSVPFPGEIPADL